MVNFNSPTPVASEVLIKLAPATGLQHRLVFDPAMYR